eukprot:6706036-Pyramimonas_sp.AAC.1
MATTDPADDEHKQNVAQVRRARASHMSGTGHRVEHREVNEVIWACSAGNFPACVKRRRCEH